MNGFWSVFKREFKGYFATPVAYVFLVIFLFASGYLPFRDGFFEIRQAELRLFFAWMPWVLIFMVSATAMRLWAEERKSGSIELLLTLPIAVPQAVLGKFFAAWAFLGIAFLLTFPLLITVYYLGHPDTGLIVTGYLGSFLLAGSYLSIGSFFSALTKNQVVGLILSVAACLFLWVAGMPTTINYLSFMLPTGAVQVIEKMSIQSHFDSLLMGVIEFKDITYFIIMIVAWISACAVVLEERKAA